MEALSADELAADDFSLLARFDFCVVVVLAVMGLGAAGFFTTGLVGATLATAARAWARVLGALTTGFAETTGGLGGVGFAAFGATGFGATATFGRVIRGAFGLAVCTGVTALGPATDLAVAEVPVATPLAGLSSLGVLLEAPGAGSAGVPGTSEPVAEGPAAFVPSAGDAAEGLATCADIGFGLGVSPAAPALEALGLEELGLEEPCEESAE